MVLLRSLAMSVTNVRFVQALRAFWGVVLLPPYLAEIVGRKPFAFPNQQLRLGGHKAAEGEPSRNAQCF